MEHQQQELEAVVVVLMLEEVTEPVDQAVVEPVAVVVVVHLKQQGKLEQLIQVVEPVVQVEVEQVLTQEMVVQG